MKNNFAKEDCENLSMQPHVFTKFLKKEIFSWHPALYYATDIMPGVSLLTPSVIQAMSGTFPLLMPEVD